ncbi:hypothetical protein IWQ60_009950 [Tieghemiomyces parasiticus]|uniref:ubiquitinyl hydrolase 1 n=1 Tax=Tieghemiomyces parasiticus TaxID=78921 RepID=A0A9W7ZVY3_9FUNG|nr:hypothetical protein IWQ60_009950 [Tieghemiomyces parasiticus]
MLQGPVFSQRDLEAIATDLGNASRKLEGGGWLRWNPHRLALGMGDYDINVLTAALRTKGYGIEWFDRRKGAAEIPLDRALGLILNKAPERIWQRRHWLALRRLNGAYWNLDSALEAPTYFVDREQVSAFLDAELACGGHVFVVLSAVAE